MYKLLRMAIPSLLMGLGAAGIILGIIGIILWADGLKGENCKCAIF